MVAADLPHDAGVELLRTAREAFAQAFVTSAAVSAALALALAVVAVILLRRPEARS